MENLKCVVLGLRLVLSGLQLIACGAHKTDDSTDYLRGAVSRADLTFPLGMEISSAYGICAYYRQHQSGVDRPGMV